MIKTKTLVIILTICFGLIMLGQILRVEQYGLYGSQDQWDKTISIPNDINSTDKTELRNLLIEGENEGLIICFPEQQICHYTGKGVRSYGAFSDWEQSSDLNGWLVLIMTSALQSLVLTVLISVGYAVIEKINK
jgi:hypothetical protein